MAADELPQVPKLLSLEGRANMIADVAGRSNFGHPDDRRKAVAAEALAHLRVVAVRAANGDGVTGE